MRARKGMTKRNLQIIMAMQLETLLSAINALFEEEWSETVCSMVVTANEIAETLLLSLELTDDEGNAV